MENPNVYNYINYREYLKAYFEERKKHDPKFSHRYLSRRLGLSSPNFIMMIMQGKRNLTNSLTFKISQEFNHEDKEGEYFECIVGFAQAKTNKEKDRYFQKMISMRQKCIIDKIDEHQYEYYSNWYNIAIRELVTYPEFKEDYKWLAKKVFPPITPTQAKRSVNLLLKLGLIKKKGSSYVRTSSLISTGPEVSSLAIVNFHRAMAEMAAVSLDTVQKDERDITACSVNISEKGFAEIKNALEECRKKVLSIAEADTPADRVYQINFQVFPLSSKNKKKKEKR